MCAVHYHEEGGELNDMQPFEERMQVKHGWENLWEQQVWHPEVQGHDIWRMIDGDRIKAWCRRFANYAQHNKGKLLGTTKAEARWQMKET